MKKFISLILSISMIMSVLCTGVVFVSADEEYDTSFYSSFEVGAEGQTTAELLENTLDTDAEGNNRTSGMGTVEADIGLIGVFNNIVTDVTGNKAFNNSEILTNLLDNDASTKYLTNTSFPVNVVYTLKEAKVLRDYALVSANDAADRDPYTWKVYGSNDNSSWIEIDSRSGEKFADRYTANVYNTNNETAYSYYKLEITSRRGGGSGSNSGMVQFADWLIASGEGDDGGVRKMLFTTNSTGPASVWVNTANMGWTGANALKLASSHEAEGRAYSYNVIYDNLNVKVEDNTQLSYTIFPDYVGNYDFEYTSQYVAIDLKFKDGTYLSELNALDENENIVNPTAQGDSKTIITRQWNQVASVIGKVASGKVIDKIIVAYDKPQRTSEEPVNILTYIDDIKIEQVDLTPKDKKIEYTNILRGTNDGGNFSRGLNIPAVTMPNGFNFWAPCTENSGTRFFNYQKTALTHFTISHQASNWTNGDRGTFQFMANTSLDPNGSLTTDNAGAGNRKADYDKDSVTANANYYAVTFKEGTKASGAKVEIAPTDHGAAVRFTYPENSSHKNVIFDSVNATSNGQLTFNNDGSFYGRTTNTSNGMRYMYFYGYFSEAPASTKVISADRAMGLASFNANEVTMKIATSFISTAQAKKNLELEITQENTFDDIKAASEKAWTDILDMIDIEGATENQKVSFYSNMYRLYMYPNSLSENIGTDSEPKWAYASPYKGSSANPTVVEGDKLYYNNGFWDTYRTTWAAYALLTPTKDTEYLNGLVQHYNDVGWVPRWIAPGGINCMVGTSSDVIFGDAYMRGIEFDYENAFKSAVKNAAVYTSSSSYGRWGTETASFLGYYDPTTINGDSKSNEGMSWSLEGYINDYGIANLAKGLGLNDEYVYYLNRAQNYVKLFNKEVGGWFVGKTVDGKWTNTANNFDPYAWGGDYTEGNAWHFAQLVPQDGQGLVNLFGSNEAYNARLDELFTTDGHYEYGSFGYDKKEMREARETRMGQYNHTNQTGHHIAYMYLFGNEPYKTQKYVRQALNQLYVGSSFGQGYLGDEDNGEQSAWYVLSSLGFYPLSMGSGEWVIGSPLFDKATVHLESGNDLVIKANNNSKDNCYIQSMTIDGAPYEKLSITHSDLIKAKEIVFEMGAEPSDWCTGDESTPTSITTGDEAARPMDDLTNAKIDFVDELPKADSVQDAAYIDADVSNAANLFNNTSANAATINAANASLYYYFSSAKIVELYTLTSYTNTALAPASAALFASNDGENWVELDTRSDISFEWAQYTRPFAVENNTAYKYYRLDLAGATSTMSIAQVELMGYEYKTATKDALLATINKAKALDSGDYYGGYDALMEVVDAATLVYNDENADTSAVYDAIVSINEAISGLKKYADTVNPYNKVEAEKYSGSSSGVVVDNNSSASGGANVGGCDNGRYFYYNDFNFDAGSGALSITWKYARHQNDCQGTPYVDLYIDGKSAAEGGTKIGRLYPRVTGNSWNVYTVDTVTLDTMVTGVHDLYFMLINKSTNGHHVANIDYFYFSENPVYDISGDVKQFPNTVSTLVVTTGKYTSDIDLYNTDGTKADIITKYSEKQPGGTIVHEIDVQLPATVGDYNYLLRVKNKEGDSSIDVPVTLSVVPLAYSAETDAKIYTVSDIVTFTVVADGNIEKLALVNESGKYIDKISESYVDNTDGTRTFTVTACVPTRGDRTVSIYASEEAGVLKDTGLTVNFTVDNFKPGSDDPIEVISVSAVSEAEKNEVFMVTVKTTMSASKIGIFSETGAALGKVSQSYVDKNGERVWTIAIKIGSKGNRTFEVKATDNTGVWSDAVDFDIVIK